MGTNRLKHLLMSVNTSDALVDGYNTTKSNKATASHFVKPLYYSINSLDQYKQQR